MTEQATLTVAEFVTARLDEDEAIARAATDGPWKVDNETYAEYIGSPSGAVVSGGRWGGEASVFDSTADAIHIALHDPARVLAQCAAMRQVLGRAGWVLANPTKVSHDEFCRAKADLYDLADIWKDHPDHVWGDVVHITQQSYDEAMAILQAKGELPSSWSSAVRAATTPDGAPQPPVADSTAIRAAVEGLPDMVNVQPVRERPAHDRLAVEGGDVVEVDDAAAGRLLTIMGGALDQSITNTQYLIDRGRAVSPEALPMLLRARELRDRRA